MICIHCRFYRTVSWCKGKDSGHCQAVRPCSRLCSPTEAMEWFRNCCVLLTINSIVLLFSSGRLFCYILFDVFCTSRIMLLWTKLWQNLDYNLQSVREMTGCAFPQWFFGRHLHWKRRCHRAGYFWRTKTWSDY